MFVDGVDPSSFATVLYSNLLLTRDEHEIMTLNTVADSKKFQDILKVLERRISVDPNVFHTMVDALIAEPALEAVGQRIKGELAISDTRGGATRNL